MHLQTYPSCFGSFRLLFGAHVWVKSLTLLNMKDKLNNLWLKRIYRPNVLTRVWKNVLFSVTTFFSKVTLFILLRSCLENYIFFSRLTGFPWVSKHVNILDSVTGNVREGVSIAKEVQEARSARPRRERSTPAYPEGYDRSHAEWNVWSLSSEPWAWSRG